MTQQDFQAMRRAMVESQLRTSGVDDPRVIAAFASVRREYFVPPQRARLAYVDRPVPLTADRALNPAMATGRLLTEGGIGAGDHVLVIGAATGYAARLLIDLAKSVVALESDAALAETARATLADSAVMLLEGPLEAGAPDHGPFDFILIDGAVEHVPRAIVDQLAPGGRLGVAILDAGISRLAIGRRGAGGGFGLVRFADVEAVPLPGFTVERGFRF